MLIIAHRALLDGPNEFLENSPEQIIKALNAGFDAEIDLRYENNEWFLGHNKSTYKIDFGFIDKYKADLWIHAKDIPTLNKLITNLHDGHFFFHDVDDCTLTNSGKIWSFPRKLPITDNSIMVMPERTDFTIEELQDGYGICTDYCWDYRKLFEGEKLNS